MTNVQYEIEILLTSSDDKMDSFIGGISVLLGKEKKKKKKKKNPSKL